MRPSRRIVLSLWAAIIIGQQAQAQNYCQDVLQYAARNYSVEKQENSVAKRIYEQSCSGSQAKSSNSLSIGLDAVVEAIPIKFSLGSGSAREKLESFCKTFDSDYKSNMSKYSENNLVSVDSVKAWNDCVRLYGEGITFNPIVNTTMATIQITKKSADPVEVNGIQYSDTQLTCKVPNDDKSPTTVKASMETRKKLLDGGTWQVACDRIAKKTGDTEIFAEADLQVHTSKGSFALKIPADASIGPQSAAAMNEQMGRLRSELTAVSERRPKLECRLSAPSDSANDRNPLAKAAVPASEGPEWFVTGGSCQANFGGHWPPVSYNGPAPDGSKAWWCQGRDPPNIPLVFQMTARVIYCRAVLSGL